MEASKLNVSSIKTLNGDMSVTPLQQLSSSSSSLSYVEATEEIQKVAKTGRKITSAEDKGYVYMQVHLRKLCLRRLAMVLLQKLSAGNLLKKLEKCDYYFYYYYYYYYYYY